MSAVANAVRRSRSGLADPETSRRLLPFSRTHWRRQNRALQKPGRVLVRFPRCHGAHRYERIHGEALGSALIGAPPGYVGYEQGGYLTELVRRRPYALILLDEVEKAHPDVFNILLQVLEDGRLTDGQGHTVDFRNCIIVMTSNLASSEIQAMQYESYETVYEVVMADIRQHFRPEFLNRIDDTIVFRSLEPEQIKQIAQLQIDELNARLADKQLRLQFSAEAVASLAKKGYDPSYGARVLRRVIQREIENPLANTLLAGSLPADGVIKIDVSPAGGYSFDVSSKLA